MFKRSLIYPISIASAAIIAFKKTHSYSGFKKSFIKTTPLSLLAISQMQSKAHMTQLALKAIDHRPKGLFKFFSYIIRFIELGLIFLPSVLLLPLAIFNRTRGIWMQCCVWSISKAGVVWIKVFQHMSHRGDVIGDELAESFEVLRSFSPQHSYK